MIQASDATTYFSRKTSKLNEPWTLTTVFLKKRKENTLGYWSSTVPGDEDLFWNLLNDEGEEADHCCQVLLCIANLV
jgi:hypothetical protein